LQGLKYVYPEDKKIGCVEVTGRDLMTLEDAEFVNDTIMDYYTMRIKDRYREWLREGKTTVQLHFFSAFFYKKLTERGSHTNKEVFPRSFFSVCMHALRVQAASKLSVECCGSCLKSCVDARPFHVAWDGVVHYRGNQPACRVGNFGNGSLFAPLGGIELPITAC
jgi:hypothetical protein